MAKRCIHKLQFRSPRYAERRDWVRRTLVLLAQRAPDGFVPRDLGPIFAKASGQVIGRYEYWSGFDFLRQHGFLNVEQLGKTRHRYELSEQAIRWLDWVGFTWAVRKGA